jgi:hypothetical protein
MHKMIIAVLFNSDDPKFHGYYGPPIRDIIFGTSVLQRSGRDMQVRYGDVLILSHAETQPEYMQLAEDTYFYGDWSLVKSQRLRATYLRQTIWAWVIQNVTRDIAQKLDAALSSETSYLGLHSVDYSHPPHLLLYRNSMIHYCRIRGTTCMLSYAMGEEEDKDEYEAESVLAAGFENVGWEARGARDTIFDDYTALDHFQRVREVQKVCAGALPEGDYAAEELVMMLQDLQPQLINILSAAARAISRARKEEDIADVYHQVLCYIEQLADALSLPSIQSHNQPRVTKQEFRRRILARIDQVITSPASSSDHIILRLTDADRLSSQIDAISNNVSGKASLSAIFFYLARVTFTLCQPRFTSADKAYYAFSERMLKFAMQCLDDPLPPISEA